MPPGRHEACLHVPFSFRPSIVRRARSAGVFDRLFVARWPWPVGGVGRHDPRLLPCVQVCLLHHRRGVAADDAANGHKEAGRQPVHPADVVFICTPRDLPKRRS
jgi:hypothetical protein